MMNDRLGLHSGCGGALKIGLLDGGSLVGAFVGNLVGAFVGRFVGALAGSLIGAFVGRFVGAVTGGALGETVGGDVGFTGSGIISKISNIFRKKRLKLNRRCKNPPPKSSRWWIEIF